MTDSCGDCTCNNLICELQATAEWGYWVPDMAVQCFRGWHLPLSLGLDIPFLLLLILGIPFLPVWTLFKRRKMLGTTQMKLHFGWIYHSYKCAIRKRFSITLETPTVMSYVSG